MSADTMVPCRMSGFVTPLHPGEAQLLHFGGRTPLGHPCAHHSALAGSSQPLAARPRVPSGLGTAEDVRIAAMAQRVKEVLPHVPLEVIRTDLGKRRWGVRRDTASPSLPGL